MDVVAVGRDRRELDAPRVVLDPVRLDDAARAALHGLAVRVRRIRDGERHVADAVALRLSPPADLAVSAEAAREDEADVALLEHVRGAVADARLGPGIGRAREAVGVLVEVRRLLRVPDPDLEVVPAVDRHEVVFAHEADSMVACGRGRPAARRRRSPTRSGARRAPGATVSGSERRIDREHGGDERLQVRASVARAGPIRVIDRNQSTFVSTSGPTVAKTSSAQISHPRCQSCSPACGMRRRARAAPMSAGIDDRADARTASTRSSAARPRPSTPPTSRRSRGRGGSPRTPPRRPRCAIRRRRGRLRRTRRRPLRARSVSLSRSRPRASPKSAAKIGIDPEHEPDRRRRRACRARRRRRAG